MHRTSFLQVSEKAQFLLADDLKEVQLVKHSHF